MGFNSISRPSDRTHTHTHTLRGQLQNPLPYHLRLPPSGGHSSLSSNATKSGHQPASQAKLATGWPQVFAHLNRVSRRRFHSDHSEIPSEFGGRLIERTCGRVPSAAPERSRKELTRQTVKVDTIRKLSEGGQAIQQAATISVHRNQPR